MKMDNQLQMEQTVQTQMSFNHQKKIIHQKFIYKFDQEELKQTNFNDISQDLSQSNLFQIENKQKVDDKSQANMTTKKSLSVTKLSRPYSKKGNGIKNDDIFLYNDERLKINQKPNRNQNKFKLRLQSAKQVQEIRNKNETLQIYNFDLNKTQQTRIEQNQMPIEIKQKEYEEKIQKVSQQNIVQIIDQKEVKQDEIEQKEVKLEEIEQKEVKLEEVEQKQVNQDEIEQKEVKLENQNTYVKEQINKIHLFKEDNKQTLIDNFEINEKEINKDSSPTHQFQKQKTYLQNQIKYDLDRNKKLNDTRKLWKGNDYKEKITQKKLDNIEIKQIKIVIKQNIKDQINEIKKKLFIEEGAKQQKQQQIEQKNHLKSIKSHENVLEKKKFLKANNRNHIIVHVIQPEKKTVSKQERKRLFNNILNNCINDEKQESRVRKNGITIQKNRIRQAHINNIQVNVKEQERLQDYIDSFKQEKVNQKHLPIKQKDLVLDKSSTKNTLIKLADKTEKVIKQLDQANQICQIILDDQIVTNDYMDVFGFKKEDRKYQKLNYEEIDFLVDLAKKKKRDYKKFNKLNEILSKLQFFDQLGDKFMGQQLFFKGNLRTVAQNKIIYQQREKAESMFIIIQGSVQIIDQKQVGSLKSEIVVDSIYDGLGYGDPSLLRTKNKNLIYKRSTEISQMEKQYQQQKSNQGGIHPDIQEKDQIDFSHINKGNKENIYEFSQYMTSVQTTEDSLLLFIDRSTYHSILTKHVFDKQEAKIGMLRKVTLFKTIDVQNLYSLIGHIQERTYNYGDVILKRGQQLDGLYIIRRGEVKVFIEFIDYNHTMTVKHHRDKYKNDKSMRILQKKLDQNDQKVFKNMWDQKQKQQKDGKKKIFIKDTQVKQQKGDYFNNRIEIETLCQYDYFGRRSLYSKTEFEKQKQVFPSFFNNILPNDPYLNSRTDVGNDEDPLIEKKIERESYGSNYHKYSQVTYQADTLQLQIIFIDKKFLFQIPEKFRTYILEQLLLQKCSDQQNLSELIQKSTNWLYKKRQFFQEKVIDREELKDKKVSPFQNHRVNIKDPWNVQKKLNLST